MKGVTVKLVPGQKGAPGLFDSQILFEEDPNTKVQNGFIVLRQRVSLHRFDDPSFNTDVDGKLVSYKCQKWSVDEWRNFVFVFRFICEDYWNRQHPVWLEPPGHFTALNVPFLNPTHRPNFQTRYEMDARDAQGSSDHRDAHFRVIVMRLKDDEFDFRSYVRRQPPLVFLTNRDIKETRHVNRWGPFVTDEEVQVAANHEQGHMIGFPHVGRRLHYPECTKDGNADDCYGKNARDRNELSGMGMGWVSVYDQPWRVRLALHTGTRPEEWGAHRQLLAPKPISSPAANELPAAPAGSP